jgi:hypothetical protein
VASNFYSGLAAVASRLLAEKGQSVSFSRTTGGSKNAATGVTAGGSVSTYTGNGAGFDYNRAERDGTIIQDGDIRLILEAVTTTPEPNDECTYDGIDYRVMSVKETSPGGTVTHYELQLRK